jgi:hypothetical protein
MLLGVVASLGSLVVEGGEATMSTERLRQAVAGLGGLAGALLLPMLSSWLRLLMQLLEPDHSGLGHQQRVSSLAVARALVLTLLLGFIVMNWQQAASELQQVQAEAPIVGSTLDGVRGRAGAVADLRAGLRGAAGRLAAGAHGSAHRRAAAVARGV